MSVLPARRVDQHDDHHGERVADPYRWLEDTDASDTREWTAAQNVQTQAWLDGVPARSEIAAQLSELWDYPRRGVPFQRGEAWFQTANSGLEDQDVLYVMDGDGPGERGRVLLDPNTLAADGTVALNSFSVSPDGRLLAYGVSEGGSDWIIWRVREVASGEDLPDVIEWSKFCTAEWLGDSSGFVYATLDRPAAGEEYLEVTPAMRLALHRLGQPTRDDEVVFSAPEQPEWSPWATVSDDGRYVVVQIALGTAPETQLRVLDLEAPERGLITLVGEFTAKVRYAANVGRVFYLLTDEDAERGRLVRVDLDDPQGPWREVLAQDDALLLAVRLCGGRLVAHRLRDACSELVVFDLDGRHLHDVAVPVLSTLLDADEDGAGFTGQSDTEVIHFGVTSFTDSGSLWRHDLSSGSTELLSPAGAGIDAGRLITEQVRVPASDGQALPLFLIHRADVSPDGDRAVLLWGYGGFDISITPVFRLPWAAFVERGGVLAVAVLRGGGEFGRSWHQAGILAQKQRVFDDFCDCARWLAESGWSRPERIAIQGKSNGGLLVGACMTQHPELFGAAVAEVGVLDMLRFHRFTIGWAWKSDFGDPDDPEQYPALRAYSPLHNISSQCRYPPVLITTGDHDDRVVPGHSFKFAATLQAAAAERDAAVDVTGLGRDDAGPSAPVLLRTETAAGHGHGMPTAKAIALAADILTFLEGTIGTPA